MLQVLCIFLKGSLSAVAYLCIVRSSNVRNTDVVRRFNLFLPVKARSNLADTLWRVLLFYCLCHEGTILVDHRIKTSWLYVLVPCNPFVGASVFILNRCCVCAVPSNPVRPLFGLGSDAVDSWPLIGAIGQRPLSQATFFLSPFGAFTLALTTRLGSGVKLRVVTSVIGVCC